MFLNNFTKLKWNLIRRFIHSNYYGSLISSIWTHFQITFNTHTITYKRNISHVAKHVWMCYLQRLICFIFFPLFENAALRCCPSMHPSHIHENVGQWTLPKLVLPIMFWRAWIRFTFKCPNWRCPSPHTPPHFFNDCVELAASRSAPYTLVKFIWYKLHVPTIISSSGPLTLHFLRFNYPHLTKAWLPRANLFAT